MTDELKQSFVDGHNKLRNEQALGKTGHIFNNKTVADMATVVSIRFSFFNCAFDAHLCSAYT